MDSERACQPDVSLSTLHLQKFYNPSRASGLRRLRWGLALGLARASFAGSATGGSRLFARAASSGLLLRALRTGLVVLPPEAVQIPPNQNWSEQP